MNNIYHLESKYIVDMFLSKRFPDKIQMFNTKNVVGDEMETIYDDGKVKIEYSKGYDYIEIFGLSNWEYEEIYFLHNLDIIELYNEYLKEKGG